MTIDQRLEKLTERHEALALAMELQSHDMETMRQTIREMFTATLESLHSLERIATAHEKRISDIEGGL